MTYDHQLTDFQRLMRSWKELAPYNAAHVLQISGTADLARWEGALNQTFSQLGSGEPLHVQTSNIDLDHTIAAELNRPFAGTQLPLRALVIPAGHDHFLALIYDHWFADSPSIRALLHRGFETYRLGTADLPPLRAAPPSPSGSAFSAITNGIRTYRRHRRATRIHLCDPLDFRTGFFSRRFALGTISAIRANARRAGAKVNDVFLAAAAHVLGEHTTAQRAASRRNEVGIASAVDLREPAADATFGFDLSYFSIVLQQPEEMRFEKLVRIVAQQTSALKVHDEVARFNLSLKCARFAWSVTSKPRRRAELFRKGLPLVAGISNVNLSGTSADDVAEVARQAHLLDYLRVSPVGPLLPLVFTLTTIRDRLSLCVSFRSTAFPDDIAAKLADAFISKLVAFSETTL